jgi:predicted ATPase/DNA-binding XRE family transcriptional regulator
MATAPPALLGSLIKHYRQASDLTQEALAERAQLSVRGLSNLERGLNLVPHHDTLERLMAALDLSATERAVLRAAAQPVQGAALPAALSLTGSSRVPLVGRQSVMARLERHLAGEGPPLMLLAGEPGIGKTRLLQEVSQWAMAHGFTVLAGGTRRGSAGEPYAPLPETLRRHVRHQSPAARRAALEGCALLVELLPELGGAAIAPRPAAAPEQQRRLMFAAVARFLTNVAGPAGTVLLLDDLQRASPDALDLLAMLAWEADASPLDEGLPERAAPSVRVVGACRETEVVDGDALSLLLTELAPVELAARHVLAPLAPDESARLFDDLLVGVAGVSPARKEQVLQRAGGVPFYLVSYAQALRNPDQDESMGVPPWDVQQSVRQRVARLSGVARAVLRVAAVLGKESPRQVLVAAVDQPADAVYAGLDEVCRERLLAEDGAGAYHFTHDLIGDVVVAAMGAAERAALHQHLGEVLEQVAGPDPDGRSLEALAYHYGRSDNMAKAVLYLERAADSAQGQGAHNSAEQYYQEALARLARAGRSMDAARVRYKLGRLLRVMGRRHEEALVLLDEAASSYRAAGDRANLGQVTAEIGRLHLARGTLEEGIWHLEGVRCLLVGDTPAAPAPEIPELDAILQQLYLRGGRYEAYVAAVERDAVRAREAGQHAALAAIDLQRGLALLALGRGEEGVLVLEQASHLAETTGNLTALVETLANAAALCLLEAKLDLVLAYVERAQVAAERLGDVVHLIFLHFLRGTALFYQGEGHRAHESFERGTALANVLGASSTSHYPWFGLAVLALARTELDDAGRYLDEGVRLARRSNDAHALRYLYGHLAERDLLAGRAAAANAQLRRLLEQPEQPGVTPFLLVRLAWAHLEVGDLEAATETVAQALTRARAERTPMQVVDGLWVQARVRMRQGRWAEAAAVLQEALAPARRLPYTLGTLRLLEAAAEVYRHEGSTAQARRSLEEARLLCARLGADREAARLQQALTALSQDQSRQPFAATVPEYGNSDKRAMGGDASTTVVIQAIGASPRG